MLNNPIIETEQTVNIVDGASSIQQMAITVSALSPGKVGTQIRRGGQTLNH